MASGIPLRLLVGALSALAIAWSAHRAGALSQSGGWAAFVCGTIAMAAGWSWGLILIAYFVMATTVSRLGRRQKIARFGNVVAKGEIRDATQVLANGGVYTIAALAFVITQTPTRTEATSPSIWISIWMWIALSALAASAADTWATEIGGLSRRTPRSIITWTPLPAGTSGAITPLGMFGSLLGALATSTIAAALGWPPSVAIAATVIGVLGAVLDSVLGATLQAERTCPACGTATEQNVHGCGTVTMHTRGLRWMTNDMVNAITTLVAGLMGALCAS